MEQLQVGEASARPGALVARVSKDRDRVGIAGAEDDHPGAVLISSEELAELEEAVALAHYRAHQASGTLRAIPHEQARARLGLQQG